MESWTRDRLADSEESARAADFARLLTDEELLRRTECAQEEFGPAPGEEYWEWQDCPLCGYEALLPQGGDHMGHGPIADTCLACSYVRSHAQAYIEQAAAEFARKMAKERLTPFP